MLINAYLRRARLARSAVPALLLAALLVTLLIGCGAPSTVAEEAGNSIAADQPEIVEAEQETEQAKPDVAKADVKAEIADSSDGEESIASESTVQESTVQESTVQESTVQESTDAMTASQSATAPLSAVSKDHTLVGNTGRPQLVYTYADW